MDNGQPLGMFADVQIDEQQITIPAGGLVLMHSDGLNEAVNSQGLEYGLQRVKMNWPPIGRKTRKRSVRACGRRFEPTAARTCIRMILRP